MRPGMAADVHSGIDPQAQSPLRVPIVVEFAGIHEAVGSAEMMGLEFSGQARGDGGAGVAGRKSAGRGQIVESQGYNGMVFEGWKLWRGCICASGRRFGVVG